MEKQETSTEEPRCLGSTVASCSATAATTLPLAQAAIDRMGKAHKNGKGVSLSWDELDQIDCSILGEWFNEQNPCLSNK